MGQRLLIETHTLLQLVITWGASPQSVPLLMQASMKPSSRRWGLGLAFLSLLAGQKVCTASVSRTLHGEQGAIAFKDGGMKSTDGKVYFSVRKSLRLHTFPCQFSHPPCHAELPS